MCRACVGWYTQTHTQDGGCAMVWLCYWHCGSFITQMQVAVRYRRYDLIEDVTFLELISLKWKQYGR